MSITSPVTEELVRELDHAMKDAAEGKHDPDKMAKALDEMKRSAEETRRKVGVLNVCVDLIRDARDQ